MSNIVNSDAVNSPDQCLPAPSTSFATSTAENPAPPAVTQRREENKVETASGVYEGQNSKTQIRWKHAPDIGSQQNGASHGTNRGV